MERIPPVAIGLPVYNGEKYLAESIESVLAQDFGDFDFLISDNCSTDSTWEICNHYASKDDRIRLNRNENNLGSIANFQLVLDQTKSKYFMWHAHDDLLHSTYINKCLSFLEQHDDYIICFSKVTHIDKKGRPYRSVLADETRNENSSIIRFKRHCQNGFPVYAIYGLIRRSVWQQVKPLPRVASGVDVVLIAELTLYGKTHQLNEALRYLRQFTSVEDSMRNLISWGPSGALGSRNKIAFLPLLRRYSALRSRIIGASRIDPYTKDQLIKTLRY